MENSKTVISMRREKIARHMMSLKRNKNRKQNSVWEMINGKTKQDCKMMNFWIVWNI